MAATRLIAIHHLKDRTLMECLKKRIEYSLNPEKTENGEYTSFYKCNEETVAEEFALSKRQYEYITGRKPKKDVIAYMIRQSFKPGEITAENANKVGYELAMRFTKGKHMFFVATHTDKKHIHNHIFINSTTLGCTRKFRNFFLSGKAVQRLSDLICIENSLSVIEPRNYTERLKEKRYKHSVKKRELIKKDIDEVLMHQPKDFEELLQLLKGKGYEIKKGKHIALKKPIDQRFIRFDSLEEGYTQNDLQNRFVKDVKTKKKKETKLNLLIDIQQKLKEGKGGGYAHWAKIFNVKQMAQTILFLQENGFESYEQLDTATDDAVKNFHRIAAELKMLEGQAEAAKEIKKQIINYSKTRDVYVAYRKAGYSRKFREEHKEQIEMHKEAKNAFDKFGMKNVPKVKELNQQISDTYEKRHDLLEEYYQAKEQMRKIVVVRENVKRILSIQTQRNTEKTL